MLAPLVVLALSSLTSAHFVLDYPFWRGDSFADDRSQWSWPCANVSQENSSTNRTAWPLDGGSLVFTGSHPWAYTYVNLGVGNNVTSFNVSLQEGFNQTGNGTFCFPKLGRAALATLDIKEGTNASVQIIQISHSGAALYNCADVTFTSTAGVLTGDRCRNATGVGGVELENEGSSSGSSSGSSTTSGAAAASSTGASGAAESKGLRVGLVVGALAVGLSALLA